MVSTSIDSSLTSSMHSTSITANPTIKKKSAGRKKIEIKKIEKSNTLQVTFSKRRNGLFKKASELCILTGAQIAVFVKSPAGRIYVYSNPHTNVLIEKYLQEKNNDNNVPMLPKNDLNQRYEEYLREFEAEINRNEMNVSSGSNEVGLGTVEWTVDDGFGYDEWIDGLGLEELENKPNEMNASSGSNDDGLGTIEWTDDDGLGYEECMGLGELENKSNEMIVSTGSNDVGLGYDELIDGMGVGELENYLCKLQEDKYDVEDRANEYMINNFYQI